MKWLRLLHRYVGLTLALFLILVSITGSLLAFYPELERLSAPAWFPAQPTITPMPLPALAERAEQIDPRIFVTGVRYDDLGRALIDVSPRIDAATQQASSVNYSEMVLDAGNGALLGQRHWGTISEGWHNLLPFLYEFHYSLIVGDTGIWLLGIVALVWFIDCFTGLVITFPRPHPGADRSWLARWKKAWLIKRDASVWRLNFDIHRAFSLWLWLALGVFAWSSVYMNLWDTVYTQVTRALMPFHPPWYELADRLRTGAMPPHAITEMFAYGDQRMRELAVTDGFDYQRAVSLRYYPEYGAYRLRVLSDLDVGQRLGRTDIYLDANTHELVMRYYPSTQFIGNTVSNWLYALHTARVWGLPYRIFVCVLGVLLVVITVTGVLIWWRRQIRKETRAEGSGTRPSRPRIS